MRTRLFVLGACLLYTTVSAQPRNPNQIARTLLLNVTKEAWIVTEDLPSHYRICGAMELNGTVRGCITVQDLRQKAAAERR